MRYSRICRGFVCCRAADGDEGNSAAGANPEWQAGGADLLPSEIQIGRWDVERMSATVRSGAGFAVLRVMDYPAWRVTVNGAPVNSRPRRDDGLMVVPVAAGISQIEVRYGATPDVWAGRILSLVAASLMAWAGCKADGASSYHETNAS